MTASAMNPTRWRPRFPGIPSLDRVADCGNHPVNAECPHVDAEMCALVENLSTGLVFVGLDHHRVVVVDGNMAPRHFGHITFNEAVRHVPHSTSRLFQ